MARVVQRHSQRCLTLSVVTCIIGRCETTLRRMGMAQTGAGFQGVAKHTFQQCSATLRRKSMALAMLDEGESSNTKFGFFLTNRIPKETCQERTVCRMMRTNGYWIRSHGVAKRIRSHMVRHLPRVISMARSRNLL